MAENENHIGKRIFFSPAVPATNDAAGFEALTWTEADGAQQHPQLGVTHNMIDIRDIKSGFTAASKGDGRGVDTTSSFRHIPDDAGQLIAKTQANDPAGEISIKMVDGTGTDGEPAEGDPTEYASGIAHSYQPNQGTDTSYKGFQFGFRQNNFTVEADHPAVV